jgi:hypothetical protein
MIPTIEIIPGDGGDEPPCLKPETRILAILSFGHLDAARYVLAGGLAIGELA